MIAYRLLTPVHSEVGDGKCPSLEFLDPKPALRGLVGPNRGLRPRSRSRSYGRRRGRSARDQTGVGRDGDRQIDAPVPTGHGLGP